ncbi:MAG: hypothetical protein WD768_23035 [Phycisphaeraceae bacterium]
MLIDQLDSRDHAARMLAETRRKQLALAIEGRPEESAVYAELAATVRLLLDELEDLDAPRMAG